MRRTAVLLGMVAALGAGTTVNAAPAGVSTEEEAALGRRLAAPAAVEQPVAAAAVAEPAEPAPAEARPAPTAPVAAPALPPVVRGAVEAVGALLDQVPGVTATAAATVDQIARSRPSQ